MGGDGATGSAAIVVVALVPRSDPVGDCSEDIQRAIDRAAHRGGAIVELASGQWNLDRPLVLKDNIELRGVGAGTHLKASSSFLDSPGPHGGHPLITTDGAENVTIRRLRADQSADTLEASCVGGRLNEYLIDVRHSKNVVVDRVQTTNPFTYSIAVVESEHFCIRNNQTRATTSGKYDQLDGIHVLDSRFGLIAGNRVDQGAGSDGDDGLAAHTMGSAVHDVTYEGKSVRGGRHGAALQFALGNEPICNIAVLNNVFWGSPVGIHTGYYEGHAPLGNLMIARNKFFDIKGPAVDLFGRISGITVSENARCRSGDIKIGAGRENRVWHNTVFS